MFPGDVGLARARPAGAVVAEAGARAVETDDLLGVLASCCRAAAAVPSLISTSFRREVGRRLAVEMERLMSLDSLALTSAREVVVYCGRLAEWFERLELSLLYDFSTREGLPAAGREPPMRFPLSLSVWFEATELLLSFILNCSLDGNIYVYIDVRNLAPSKVG